MYCKKCGALLRENAVFCESCGESVTIKERKKKGRIGTLPVLALIVFCMVAGWLFLRQISAAEASEVKVGEAVRFGSYEQDVNEENGPEPIEWIVLYATDTQALLISKNILECMPYNDERMAVTWEDSNVRKWLNESFFEGAFQESEKQRIALTALENKSHPTYGTDGGNNTQDRVFLLSLEDVTNPAYGFLHEAEASDALRQCAVTAYAKTKGIAIESVSDENGKKETGRWWLRTPGVGRDHALSVNGQGGVSDQGGFVDGTTKGIRPAIWISLQ